MTATTTTTTTTTELIWSEVRGSRTITIENDEFTIKLRGPHYDDRRIGLKTRVYVSGAENVNFEPAYELERATGGMKPRGDVPEVDKMYDRLNRQVIKNKRSVIENAIAEFPVLADLLDAIKFNFSRYAGCSCPCSPGFIASRPLIADNKYVVSIYITKR